MISFPLFTSSANSFWTSKFQWISDYETLHPFPIPPPARCFQFTWQLLICSPNPFLLGLTRFKVTPSPLETLKILCTQRWLSPLSTKKISHLSLPCVVTASVRKLEGKTSCAQLVRKESQGYSTTLMTIRISFGTSNCCCTRAIMMVKVWLCVFKIVNHLWMKSPTIVTKRRGHRKADCNPHDKTVIGLKEKYWNSLLLQKTIHNVFSCTWKRCLRGETIGKRERVLRSTRAGQRSGAHTWSWSMMLKVFEDRRSLWKIACWWVWKVGNLPRKANHVGVSMKTKDQGTREPGC